MIVCSHADLAVHLRSYDPPTGGSHAALLLDAGLAGSRFFVRNSLAALVGRLASSSTALFSSHHRNSPPPPLHPLCLHRCVHHPYRLCHARQAQRHYDACSLWPQRLRRPQQRRGQRCCGRDNHGGRNEGGGGVERRRRGLRRGGGHVRQAKGKNRQGKSLARVHARW